MKIIILNVARIDAPYATGYHSHDFWQIDYYNDSAMRQKICLDGTFSYLDDTKALIIPPGCRHSIESFSACRISTVKFEVEPNAVPFRSLSGSIIDIADFKDIFTNIFSVSIFEDQTEEEIRKHYLYIFLLRYKQLLENSRTDENNQTRDPRIREAILYIRRNMTADLALNNLAARAGMSVNSFIKTFRAETGTTPMRFVRQLIAHRAIEMLAYSDLTQAEIAKRLNFQDLHAFSRCFRRETGTTPGNYRRRNREPKAHADMKLQYGEPR